ncbi:hypothetical protein HPB50_006689 [Hyalomma asiaticum]|uniref:Uncharacterized protein n=1 Tax=Hyalomma asiaticum TaxID=266040 RepID=A0ACB7TBT9_HYAAI|nr:hypothetical protein HPB50_006689 [Hyalomma asiaticum]
MNLSMEDSRDAMKPHQILTSFIRRKDSNIRGHRNHNGQENHHETHQGNQQEYSHEHNQEDLSQSSRLMRRRFKYPRDNRQKKRHVSPSDPTCSIQKQHQRTYEEEAEEEEQRPLKTRLRTGSTKVTFAEAVYLLPSCTTSLTLRETANKRSRQWKTQRSRYIAIRRGIVMPRQRRQHRSLRYRLFRLRKDQPGVGEARGAELFVQFVQLSCGRQQGPAQRPAHATPRIKAKQEMQQEDYDRLRPLSYTRPPGSSSCASASTLPTPWSTIWSREAGATPTVPKRARRSHREENDVWNTYTLTRPLPRRKQQPMVPGELRTGWWKIFART